MNNYFKPGPLVAMKIAAPHQIHTLRRDLQVARRPGIFDRAVFTIHFGALA
jgi:hypothetical protein